MTENTFSRQIGFTKFIVPIVQRQRFSVTKGGICYLLTKVFEVGHVSCM
jgi:hypothetical protein